MARDEGCRDEVMRGGGGLGDLSAVGEDVVARNRGVLEPMVPVGRCRFRDVLPGSTVVNFACFTPSTQHIIMIFDILANFTIYILYTYVPSVL